MITAKLDVTKIDKTKLFKGEKGTYLEIVLIETPNGQYGDYMVVQGTTKEEREAGKKGAILGNGKIFQKRGDNTRRPATQRNVEQPTATGDDVPF